MTAWQRLAPDWAYEFGEWLPRARLMYAMLFWDVLGEVLYLIDLVLAALRPWRWQDYGQWRYGRFSRLASYCSYRSVHWDWAMQHDKVAAGDVPGGHHPG